MPACISFKGFITRQEIEQIPLFMTKMPEHIDPEKGAGILALQDLKYQEDDPNCMNLIS